MTESTDYVEPTHPFPPRYWWLKRIILASILLALTYAGLMWWWRYEGDCALQAEVDAIRARGEPILIGDFASKTQVRDEDNAATTLSSAAAAIRMTRPQQNFVDWFDLDQPIDAGVRNMLSQLSVSTAPSRQLVRQARFQNDVDWGVQLRSPVISILLPGLNTQRELAEVLSYDALHEHLSGHDAEAVELTRDLVRQADLVEQYCPVLIAHLVAVAMAARIDQLVRVMSYDLDVQTDPAATTQPTGPTSAAQVKALISELLDDTQLRRSWSQSMYGERLLEYDVASHPGSISAVGNGLPDVWLLQPMLKLDAVPLLRGTSTLANAGTAPDFQTASARAAPRRLDRPTTQPRISFLTTALSQSMGLSDTVLERHYRGLAWRRIAALRLAIALYRVDHGGQFPPQLEDLVPGYLPKLPADPFSADGRSFGYRPSPQPMLWSVGIDGKDGGGDATLPRGHGPTTIPAGHPLDSRQWERADVIFPLKRPDPLPPEPSDGN